MRTQFTFLGCQEDTEVELRTFDPREDLITGLKLLYSNRTLLTSFYKSQEMANQNAPLLIAETLADPGEYLVPLMKYREIIPNCVCDTGSDINIMPLEISTKLWKFKLEQPDTILLLPNSTVINPIGALPRVPVQIRTFIMPTYFIVVDAHRRPGTPLVLGRLFLATVGAIIDARGGYINFKRLGCRFKQAEPVDNELTLLGFVDSDSDYYSDDDA